MNGISRKLVTSKEYLQYTAYKDVLARKRLAVVVEQVLLHTRENEGNHIKVLDLGCGIGGMTFPLSSLGCQVVGVDIDSETIAECNGKNTFPNATYIAGDIATLRLQKEFNVVVCSEVLEHSPRPDLLLQTIRKHLAQDGIAIVTVPNGYCFYEIVFSRVFQRLRVLSLFHKLPKNVYTALTGSPSPYHSLNIFCNHLQFFSFGSFNRLLYECGFRIVDVSNLSLGLFLDWKWLSSLRRIECRMADFAPHLLAGGWVFVIQKGVNAQK